MISHYKVVGKKINFSYMHFSFLKEDYPWLRGGNKHGS